MQQEDLMKFASDYVHEMSSTGRRGQKLWARLDELIDDDPTIAWRLIIEILERTPAVFLNVVGAGPLESLLLNEPALFSEAIRRAASDLKFREALRYVRGVAPLESERAAYDNLWK